MHDGSDRPDGSPALRIAHRLVDPRLGHLQHDLLIEIHDHPAAGLAVLEEIPADRIASYQPYWAARGHVLQLLDRQDEAQTAFTRAASLTDDPALRAHLFARSGENV